jgi:hypothetical protein
MKVIIRKQPSWFGPYQLAEMLCFWAKDEVDEFGMRHKPEWVYDFAEKLAGKNNESKLSRFFEWVHKKRHRKNYIRIDKYDTWSMDQTLAPIILPLLKQLKATKHGSQMVDLEDVPESQRLTQWETHDDQASFDFYHNDNELNMQNIACDTHTRWDWVMDEMIWAFEQIQPDYDWEKQYWIVQPEIDFTKHEEDEGKTVTPVRWKVEGQCDWDGRMAHQARITNGLRLFGKYFQGLWD